MLKPTPPQLSCAVAAALLVAVALGACSDGASSESASSSSHDVGTGAASNQSDDADSGTPFGPYAGVDCDGLSAGDLFDRRIAPLMAEDRPKSCNQCHLSGVDYGSFIRGTPCETMSCLVDQGMVNLDTPKDSKILSWIERADPASSLITEQVIAEEYDAFLDWSQFSAACGQQVCGDATCDPPSDAPCCDTVAEPSYEDAQKALEQTEGCSDLEIEQLFRDSVYSSRGRCYACHFDYAAAEIAGNPPPWIRTGGNCNEASLATLREVEKRGFIDVEHPDESLLLLKPLAEDEGGLPHGGGDKFHAEDDSAYANISRFIEHYAACKREQ